MKCFWLANPTSPRRCVCRTDHHSHGLFKIEQYLLAQVAQTVESLLSLNRSFVDVRRHIFGFALHTTAKLSSPSCFMRDGEAFF
jgi:hypothetical protein